MSQAGIINVSGGGGGGSPIETLTGNNSTVHVTPTANNINIVGTGAVTVTGDIPSSTLTISVSDLGLTWTDESLSFNAAASNGYFILSAITATLPAVAAQGDTVEFIVDANQLFTIQANAGQRIRIGSAISSVAGTAMTNTDPLNLVPGSSVTLIYRATSQVWISGDNNGSWVLA